MMHAVGLITEYNPFHNGHLHHLRESKQAAGADVVVAVMSGHFLQRGEAALVDKWTRTEMALAAGVDVVVELPLPWACSSAPDFAGGAVAALAGLGGIDSLCFGSEAGVLPPLQQCADMLSENAAWIDSASSRLLRQGVSYPQAKAGLLADLVSEDLDADALAAPNNILGIEYLKVLRETNSAIEPLTIRRIGAGYHETEVGAQNIASATGIRKLLADKRPIDELIPAPSLRSLQAALAEGRRFSDAACYKLLLAQIFRAPEQLCQLWLVDNGIENRLLAVADQADDLEGLIDDIKTRQLTRTRIQRMLIAILLGIKKQEAASLLAAGPRYLHLLGMSRNGERFLAATRKHRRLPLVQNFSRIYTQLKRFYGRDSEQQGRAQLQLALELRATELYTLLLRNWPGRSRKRDFFEELRRTGA